MKSLITAVFFAIGASAAMAAPGNFQPGNADANLSSLIEQLGGGSDTSTSDLSQLLTSLLGLSGGGSADLDALVEQLAALDFQVLADEIAALRESLGMYRYSYVGVADALVTEDESVPAFWNLSDMCEATFGEGARLARTSDVAYLLEGGDFPLAGVDRAIFKSSLPIPYSDGLYDTLVNAEVDLDGVVIYDGVTDRFVAKDPTQSANPACSARGE
jgi:hypothetical protein